MPVILIFMVPRQLPITPPFFIQPIFPLRKPLSSQSDRLANPHPGENDVDNARASLVAFSRRVGASTKQRAQLFQNYIMLTHGVIV